MSYLDKIKKTMDAKVAETSDKKKYGNEKEWVPDFGTHKIRILPPINEDQLFYHTHSYHYLEGVPEGTKGTYLYTKREYDVGGKSLKCPIDEACAELYEHSRQTKDETMSKLAGSIKRKRAWYFNILLEKEDGTWEHKILVDTSNKAKLARIICSKMKLPLFMDVDGEWIDKDSTNIDEDKESFDLLDIENGHDFKIVKKKTGNNNWDFTYEESFPITKSRALSAEQRELLNERVDLTTLKKYEDDYNKVKAMLNKRLGIEEENEEKEAEKPSNVKPLAKPATKPAATKKAEISEDELLAELNG